MIAAVCLGLVHLPSLLIQLLNHPICLAGPVQLAEAPVPLAQSKAAHPGFRVVGLLRRSGLAFFLFTLMRVNDGAMECSKDRGPLAFADVYE